MYYHHFGYGWGYGWGPDSVSSWAPWLLALAPLFILLVAWSLFWKGLALWHSARRGQPWWYVILLFVNTLGILEIIYLFVVAKLKREELFSKREHRS